MKLHSLKPNAGTTKNRKRLGRGAATGQGKTAGRGQDGQKSRSGGSVRIGFEGGQMPLARRLPKRGFSNARFMKDIHSVNVKMLNQIEEGTEVTPALLIELGLIDKIGDGVKVLGHGELEKKLTVKAHKFSKTAVEKIEAAGGKAEVI